MVFAQTLFTRAVDPVIGEVRSLDEVVQALTAVEERRATGKILLVP